MSEAKEEAPKKKGGGKLPIIAAVAIVLAGGGFFMTKGKGDKKEAPKKIELGEPVVLKEILVNLADGDTYLKTEIALQCEKTYDAKELEKLSPIINNTIILILKTKKPKELMDLNGLRKLQREIATKVNAALPPKEGEEKKDEKKDDKKSDEKDSKDSKKADSESKDSEFDSETGPVRKVYFSSFATQ